MKTSLKFNIVWEAPVGDKPARFGEFGLVFAVFIGSINQLDEIMLLLNNRLNNYLN